MGRHLPTQRKAIVLQHVHVCECEGMCSCAREVELKRITPTHPPPPRRLSSSVYFIYWAAAS